jgi:peptidoglycan/LPS O-acetylase OafA/YrhL
MSDPCIPTVADRYYRPELDLLRFLAFFCVFATHRMDMSPIDARACYWGHHISLVGVFGVPVFFLLSAFLITELLTREQEATGSIDIKAFYARRILRIWPLYFAFFFGLVLLTRVFPPLGRVPTETWLPFSFFAGNWYISTHFWLPSYPVNLLWSISVEEQFYILIPLLTAFGGRFGLKVFSFACLVVAYAFIALYASYPTGGFNSEWTNSFVHFQFFAAGTLLSLYLRGRQPTFHPLLRLLLPFAALACWLTASIVFGIHADAPHHSSIPQALCGWLLVLAGAVLLLFTFLGMPERYIPRPLVYLGRISYGLYVYHAGMYFLVYAIFRENLNAFCERMGIGEWWGAVGMVMAFAATVLVASLSYRFFERPFLRLKDRFTIVPSHPR